MTKALVRRSRHSPARRQSRYFGLRTGVHTKRCPGPHGYHCRKCGFCIPRYRGLGRGVVGLVDYVAGTGMCKKCFDKELGIQR